MTMWQCPLCKLPLTTTEADEHKRPLKTWFCENKHSFDKAKQGYVNLLPVQNKRSKMPGDDSDMVSARTLFFSREPYQVLVDKLAEIINTYVPRNKTKNSVPRNHANGSSSPINIYDSGCGEGFYLKALSKALSNGFSYAGHDISKAAVVAASKQNKDKQLVVASTINIPVLENSQDVILQVFAPSCTTEYTRILKVNGIVITVEPAPLHLIELKALVYDSPELHQENQENLDGFEVVEKHPLNFNVVLNEPSVRLALLQMTPFYWKTNQQSRQAIQDRLQQVTADFKVTVWQAAQEPEVHEKSDLI